MRFLTTVVLLLLFGLVPVPPVWAEVDRGVIRLDTKPPGGEEAEESTGEDRITLADAPRAFDLDAFSARLEGIWFERKALAAEGREADAARQAELMKAFCAAEGVQRMAPFASALLAEARRHLEDGSYEKALRSLDLAETFDPGRAQIRMARATVFSRSGGGVASAAAEWVLAIRAHFRVSGRDLTLFTEVVFLGLIALLGCVAVFGSASLARHHVAVRHEISEALALRGMERWADPAGWAVLLAPLLSWIGAGWAALYWIPATFRQMRRAERAAALVLLLATVAVVPFYRLCVGIYGLTADPLVRTTLAAASGVYDPERVAEMRRLVEAEPEEAIYRYLLAGLSKNGGYFEEAYEEYKKVLALEPSSFPANVNVGNIFFHTGQYGEAIAYYRRALESRPDSVLVLFNLHLAQSEAFDFRGAEASLNRAKSLDERRIAELLSRKRPAGQPPEVLDATFGLGTILRATLGGSRLRSWLTSGSAAGPGREIAREFRNPVSLVATLSLLACGIALASLRRSPPAERCARCGRPFCRRCKSGREAHGYCSQCLHLFVLGDGLAPETKTRKLYEIERHERVGRLGRRFAGAILPGASQLLRGHPWRGSSLVFLWILGWLASMPALLASLERGIGLGVRVDLLRVGFVPAAFEPRPLALVAVPLLVAVWIAGNLGRGSRAGA